MAYLIMIRNLILGIGWPVLITGSIILFIKGRSVYSMVKTALVGKITKTLVFTMLIEMYSLGIVCTAYMMADPNSTYLVLVVFLTWFIVFVSSLRVLMKAEAEVRKMMQK
jgi:hypothetical protein